MQVHRNFTIKYKKIYSLVLDSAPNPASESRPSFSPSSPDKSFSTTTEVSSEPVETYKVENPLCPTVARYVYPKRGKTKDDQFKFIINEPDTAYVQAVRVSDFGKDALWHHFKNRTKKSH